ncbi:hypothetical protein VDGL01_09044 [Verticillium dahliae]
MCHGHPRHHPCSHTSVNWHYCPAAIIDLDTGIETPCSHLSYAAAQPSNTDCALQNCHYKAMGGSWSCCQCQQTSNKLGWCTNIIWKASDDPVDVPRAAYRQEPCAHGCCERCSRSTATCATSPGMTFPELRKGTASRKFGFHPAPRSSHRRGSAFSLLGGFPPVSEEEMELEAAGSEASGYGSSTAPTKSQCSRTSSSSTSASSVESSHYEELDRGVVGVAAGQRKHRSSGSSGKGHVGKKHKTRAC